MTIGAGPEAPEVEVIALRALVGRQTARLASAIARRGELEAIVRRGLTAPSGVAICCCPRFGGARLGSPCWYCELRAALATVEETP